MEKPFYLSRSLLTVDCRCEVDAKFTLVKWGITNNQSMTLTNFRYRTREPMFHSKMTKLEKTGKYFAVFFTGLEVERNMGLKIDEVYYSIPHFAIEKQKMEPISTRFNKHIQLFKACPEKEIDTAFKISFHVKLSSPTANFDYQLVDDTWLDELWKAAQTKQLSDVEFLVDGKSFGAHRFIVSARSPVFAAMFSSDISSDMVEANTGKVVINDTNSGVFETFLKFLYTGTLEPFSSAGDKPLQTNTKLTLSSASANLTLLR